MSRKRPSVHSDDQFALFLEKIKATRDADQDARFEVAVSKLIRRKSQRVDRPVEPSRPVDRNSVQPRRAGPVKSVLPSKSDFDAVEAAGRDTADDRTDLVALIGHLVLGWSNNASLMIYVLMLLLETDERSAAAVFATLNTTAARIDLVRRLALLKVGDAAMQTELEGVIERLDEASRVRSEFLHGMYAADEQGKIMHTQSPRFVEKRGRISFGERQPIDDKRVERLVESRNDLRELNRQLWDLLPRLQASIARTARVQARSNASTS